MLPPHTHRVRHSACLKQARAGRSHSLRRNAQGIASTESHRSVTPIAYFSLPHRQRKSNRRALAATVSDATHSDLAGNPDAGPCDHRTLAAPASARRQRSVVCVPTVPSGASGPLGPGPSPIAGLTARSCSGVAPSPVSQAHARAGAKGGDPRTGEREKQRANARRFLRPLRSPLRQPHS